VYACAKGNKGAKEKDGLRWGLEQDGQELKKARMASAGWRVIQTKKIPVSMTGPKRG